MKKRFILLGLFISYGALLFGQSNFLKNSRVSGNFQLDAQYYIPDASMGADTVRDKIRANAFANINYTNGGFSAGLRYEFYQFPLIDFEKIHYIGHGIPHYYIGYDHEYFEVTLGSFYEQFGNGLVYRSYENRNLGYDNATYGIRVKGKPYKGIVITGIWGLQRNLFAKEGQIRGIDGDISFSEMFSKLSDNGFSLGIGGSLLSKYEVDNDPVYNLPENVAAFAARLNFGYKDFNLNAEYAYKFNDPLVKLNDLIYKNGEALILTASYAMKGLGVYLTGLRTDNMDFRTIRTAEGNNNIINYIPTLTREHTYALPAMFPYASQAQGQIGFQAQVNYQIKKRSKIGGKYGTDIMVNYSRIHQIQRNPVEEAVNAGGDMTGTDGYTSPFFGFGQLLFQDLNVEISRKFNSMWKLGLGYVFLIYNQEVIEGHIGEPNVLSHSAIADLTCQLNNKHALRLELQHLFTKQRKGDWSSGNWFYGQLEYSISPKWFISFLDRYNYGHEEKSKRIHYYSVSGSFVYGTTKITLSFGKQYEGVLCVGGVCRAVPASYGAGLSIVSSF
ncbi:MAG: DUF6029 family protein [Bacteroidales bacterium]|jgi:hypothetical protein|nr:DUF6029 family protein [Bacteroidales bacterium]